MQQRSVIGPVPRQLERPQKRYRLPEILCACEHQIGVPQHQEKHGEEKDQESITEDLALHPARDILLPGKAEPATQQAEQLAASAVAIAVTLGSFRDGDDQRNEEAEQSQPCKQDVEESQHQIAKRYDPEIVIPFLFHAVTSRISITVAGHSYSLAQEGVTNAEIYLSQNDGTLMTMDYARRYPILTVACGPTNSIRGASYLSRLDNAIVIDVGGTTNDLGVIQSGFPRESGVAVTIGGVRTNFRMPDVYSIGLGGGSIVRERPDGSVTVGPDSVGYEITKKALVFGGDTLTATDIAVRLGMAQVGDPEKVAHIDENLARKAMDAIRELVEDSIDVMKVSSDDLDVILVGGGSIILPEQLAGTRSVTKPNFFGTANAIGSAISKVSGTYEALINYDELPRDQALEKAKCEAVDMAVNAGAIRETVEIIEVEDVPLAYYPGNTCRVKVKAAGELA